MMSDCPLTICHKKGEYIWIGDFVDMGRFLLFLELWSFYIVSRCFILYLYFLTLDVFCLVELSMIEGDTMMYLYLFLVSHCATLIIDLYL